MSEPDEKRTEYRVTITRVDVTPAPRCGYENAYQHRDEWVTQVTLDPEQWKRVQAAIVEALK